MINHKIEILGDQALLILSDQPLLIAQFLQQQQISGIVEIVPAIDSVLITLDPQIMTIQALIPQLIFDHAESLQLAPSRTIHIPIQYDGDDLADIATRCGLSVAEIIQIHSSATYRVAMIGFLPGFPYLDGLPDVLHLPRRSQPRAKVAAGSVAIAGKQTGIYPQISPGGWHILGHTDALLFDVDRDPPTLLQAGDVVIFQNREQRAKSKER